MHLRELTVQGFRNYAHKKTFSFSKSHTIIVGKNSLGKTNILEALYFVNQGRGFREKHANELIFHGAKSGHVEAVYDGDNTPITVAARLQCNADVCTKVFMINGLPKPFKEYRERTKPVVLFQPTDLDIITGAPSLRREAIDTILQTVDYEYTQAKNNYERGLYKRNKMLQNAHFPLSADTRKIQEFWDKFLEKHARYLTKAREEFVAFLNGHPSMVERKFKLEYVPNIFSPERIQSTAQEEERYRRTVVGPQLDDFVFYSINEKGVEKNLALYGSRSEQRLAILWLKLNELIYYDQELSEQPLFLIDDIFSELDTENSAHVLGVAKQYQTCLTTAHREILPLLPFTFQTIELD